MPLADTAGVVLRMSDWSETSAIVTWFTRDVGKLRTVAKGAHRPKSAFRGRLDLFYLDDIVYVPSRRGELHTLAECYVENPFPRIRERLDAFTAASYCCELVDLATEPEGPVPPLFELLVESLTALDVARDSVAGIHSGGSRSPNAILPSCTDHRVRRTRSTSDVAATLPFPLFIPRFELLALDALGFRPDVEQLRLDPGTRRIITDLLENKPSVARLRLSPAQHRQLDSFLSAFLAAQFGRLPKSRRLLTHVA